MNLLNNKRQLITSKLTFKSKQNIPAVIIKKKIFNNNIINEKNLDIPLNEEDIEKKEFITEEDLKKGLQPEIPVKKKIQKIEPLPKEYIKYKKNPVTHFEKEHFKKIKKEKKRKTIEQKMAEWDFDTNYEKYQKLLTFTPQFTELPRISGV